MMPELASASVHSTRITPAEIQGTGLVASRANWRLVPSEGAEGHIMSGNTCRTTIVALTILLALSGAPHADESPPNPGFWSDGQPYEAPLGARTVDYCKTPRASRTWWFGTRFVVPDAETIAACLARAAPSAAPPSIFDLSHPLNTTWRWPQSDHSEWDRRAHEQRQEEHWRRQEQWQDEMLIEQGLHPR
jgi:hypothetical protein